MTNTFTKAELSPVAARFAEIVSGPEMGSWQTCWICGKQYFGVYPDCGAADPEHIRKRNGG